MEQEILAVAEREEKRLLAELETMPIYQKLVRVRAVIAVYRGTPNVFIGRKPAAATTATAVSPARSTTAARGTKRHEIEDAVQHYLEEKRERATSGELYEVVTRAGIDIGGRVPSKALASMLSTSTRFNNVQGLGYGPVAWGDGPGPKGQKNEALPDNSEKASQITGSERQTSLLNMDSGND